jgi:3',5'-cyclic AMP phosphodiesterase CpdA
MKRKSATQNFVPTKYFCSRRVFVAHIAAGAGALLLPWPRSAAGASESTGTLRFGLIADVHQDIMHDSEERLRAFVERMKSERVGFVLQLGDFCTPIDRNQRFMDIWRSFPGPRYHVLGNHDMDGGFSRQQAIAFLGMPARYYSFERSGVHFVVLDGNDPGPGQKPYYRYIAEDQARWLAQDLATTKLPVLIFSHQPLDHEKWGIENHAQIRSILEQANQSDRKKVVACFSGHLHRDYCRVIKDIPYVQINSAAYFWIGPAFAHARYGAEIEKTHLAIKNTVPYREPLWAMVTIEFDRKIMAIEGKTSEFVGPSPWELGANRKEFEAETVVPAISNRRLSVS